MVVTWGANTTHEFNQGSQPASFGTPAPGAAPPTFGAPAPTGAFGGAPGGAANPPAFGAAPAPLSGGGLFGGGGGLFGSITPAPAPGGGGGLFGAPAPTGGSIFGAPSPAPGTSLFGAPATGSLFGAPAPSSSLFGQAPAPGAPPQPPAQPAQAALQAHMQATAKQEEERIQQALGRVYHAYAGSAAAPSDTLSSPFVTVVYSQTTPEMKQQQALQGFGADGQPLLVAPPKPPQVSQSDWEKAVVRNTQRENYMPTALVGAQALHARLTGQQMQADDMVKTVAQLNKTADIARTRYTQTLKHLQSQKRRHEEQRRQLLELMRRVEILRCLQTPLQQDESLALQRAVDLSRRTDDLCGDVATLQDYVRNAPPPAAQTPAALLPLPADAADRHQLLATVSHQRKILAELTTMLDKENQDLETLRRHLETQMDGPPPPALR